MRDGRQQVSSDLQQDPWSSVLPPDDKAVSVQRASHLHLVSPAAEDTRHALAAEDSCFMRDPHPSGICRSYLEEGNSLRSRSALPDMDQHPPDGLHAGGSGPPGGTHGL